MTKEKLQQFKELLLEHKKRILNHGMLVQNSDLVIDSDDLFDEADLASSVITQQVTFNIREKEYNKLRMIDEALAKIEGGSYGLCEDCDEPIGEKRLLTTPWTPCCITHAEEREREEQRNGPLKAAM